VCYTAKKRIQKRVSTHFGWNIHWLPFKCPLIDSRISIRVHHSWPHLHGSNRTRFWTVDRSREVCATMVGGSQSQIVVFPNFKIKKTDPWSLRRPCNKQLNRKDNTTRFNQCLDEKCQCEWFDWMGLSSLRVEIESRKSSEELTEDRSRREEGETRDRREIDERSTRARKTKKQGATRGEEVQRVMKDDTPRAQIKGWRARAAATQHNNTYVPVWYHTRRVYRRCICRYVVCSYVWCVCWVDCVCM